MTATSRSELAEKFRAFAPHCNPGSPLYEDLAYRVAEDEELLALAAEAQAGQPPPNMLFAAAHDLLLRGIEHPAAAYYPTLGGSGAPGPQAFEAFKELCLTRRAEIVALLQTRRTQTNETRRCAYLLPGFAVVAAAGGRRPLALIELGPSAGLNMLWDRYGYDYGQGLYCGDRFATVRISTELRGPLRPPLPEAPPEVAWRIGVELSPVDLEDAEALRWLEALIWPEQLERVARFRAAVALARVERPRIVAGDALELLPELIAEAPREAILCVYHTHVTYQFSPTGRRRLDEVLAAAGRERHIQRLSCEGDGAEHPRLMLTSYGANRQHSRLLAITPGHANWLEWRDDGIGEHDE